MFQKFFEDTIMSRFIKNLLATSPIPLLRCVDDGDIILNNETYIYRDFIIKCVESGRLNVPREENLYPSDDLFPSIILYPESGEPMARFKVMKLYESSDRRYNYTFHSKFSYYDSDTHKHLGEYLRYLKSMKSLDLMPYYNCYNYTTVDNVCLKHKAIATEKTFVMKADDRYKVIAVPIKFLTNYTVAIDCSTEVLLRCVIYNDTGMVSKPSTGGYWSDDLEGTFISKPNTSFNKPFLYNVATTDIDIIKQQKNLYLLIQVPKSNNSSVVVLEGDYTDYQTTTRVVSADVPDSNKDSKPEETGVIVTKKFNPQLSLLSFNCKTTFAFSDRLIEYLLLNVIHINDEIYENVAKVQQAMCDMDNKLNNKYQYSDHIASNRRLLGLWDEKLSETLESFIEDSREMFVLTDMDTNVNKDVEQLFIKRGVNY